MFSSSKNKSIMSDDNLQTFTSDLFKGIGKDITHIFKEEGRYFLSVLLLAIGTKKVPYTTKTLSGISLSAVNNLFARLHKAYHHEEIYNKQSEQLLFLINTEYIFQPSLLKGIFLTCKNAFDTMSIEALSEFSYILTCLPLLRSCPLNVMKLELWKYFSQLHLKLLIM